MTPDQLEVKILQFKNNGWSGLKFIDRPGYDAWRAALNELKEKYKPREVTSRKWGALSSNDAKELCYAGADPDQIYAIFVMAFGAAEHQT